MASFITWAVSNSLDDVLISDLPEFSNSACIFGKKDGKQFSSAFRFVGVPVWSDSVLVLSAKLIFQAYSSDTQTECKVIIKGEASDTSNQITSYSDFMSRPLTSDSTAVEWIIPAWSAGNIKEGPDISGLVQEIVRRPGWTEGNDITIFVLGITSAVSASRAPCDYDQGVSAKISIAFDSIHPLVTEHIYVTSVPVILRYYQPYFFNVTRQTYYITTSNISLIYQPNAAPALPFVSTKGAKWQIGVWHPIPNPHFDKGDRCISKLNSDFLTGDVIALASSYYFSEHLQVGDAVKIGPSSYPGFKGAIEYGLVIQKLVAPERLKFSEPLQAKYKAGDSLIAWGTSIPSGAVHTQSGTKWTSLGTIHKTLDYLFGAPWALGLQHDGSLDVAEIIMSSGQRLLSNTKYFFSVIYKSGVISAQVKVRAIGGLISLTVSTGQSLWTEVSGLGTSQTAPFAIDDGYASFYKTASLGSVAGLYFKTVVLMHCADTSQESSGVLTLNAYPDRSVSVKVDSGSKDVKTIDDEIIVFNNSVGNNTKLEINAKFSKVDQTTLNDLQRLEEWQNKGCLLCLNAHLFDIPKWMIGKMEIRDITRDEETKLVSFGFLFEELV